MKRLLIFLLAIVFLFTAYFIFNRDENTYVGSPKDNDFIFGKWGVKSAVHLGENDPFNFYFLESRYKNSFSNIDNIKNVSLKGMALHEISSYELSIGDYLEGGYYLNNLILHLKAINIGKENIKELTIEFSDGTTKSYPIGNLSLEVLDGEKNREITTKEHMALSSDYTYYGVFKNNTQDSIQLKDFIVENESLRISNVTIDDQPLNNQIINPEQYFNLEANLELSNSNYEFHRASLVLTYVINEEIKRFYLDPVEYGSMNINDDTIKSILED
ncbi:hypothetical protein [Bacillus solimangrovi]|uniref:Uncharacterized protein n=1 Tax=Bacillus solimangrovi TaxID=1305675 RepID=A0A1E5LDA3_9BACI|nr:hypothetical protein [Bacillus solimangrovi]OEH92019.1 hypothetical protein BFG57_17290 [Bacillus solimangrovi]